MTTSAINTHHSQPKQLTDSELKLTDIIKSLPSECFVQDARKAWFRVGLTVSMVSLGYIGLAIAPWYLLPLLWIFTGTALTGFFVIGHDCGHRSFS
ncbi:MAG: fatty acid desaturase, partial [Leptolyngbyaceae cyanobacterium CSU_1_4]|nr:fatty acid desaturase [Leptolyngbyaceae cyanobacterium CSU_1_4]